VSLNPEDVLLAWEAVGWFSRFEDLSPGAMRKGERVEKVNTATGDTHQDGELATVEMCIGVEGQRAAFVIWDSHPGVPVFITADRLRRIG
jgi:hypothetical protein